MYACVNFLRELIEEKIVSLKYVHTNTQLAYLFTKALDFQTPVNLRKSIDLLHLE